MDSRSRFSVVSPPGSAAAVNPTWTRPSDWVSLGTPSSNSIKILFAVWDHDSNFFAVRCSGAYTIDYGDGNAPTNYATGTLAEKNLSWASYNNSTLTSQGFRQAVITITPQAANNITAFRSNEKNTTDTNTSTSSSYGFLEIIMNCPNLATLNVGTQTTSNTQIPRLLQNFEMQGTTSLTSLSQCFNNCVSLQKCTLITSSINGSCASCFNNCRSLVQVSLSTNLGGATSMASFFNNCSSLVVAPTLDVNGFADNLFSSCISLEDISAVDIAGATTTFQTFSSCSSLKNVGNIDARTSTDATGMFTSCTGMQSIGNVDLRAYNTGTGLFGGCSSLRTVGTLDLRAQTNFTNLFLNCTALISVGTITSTAVTNLTSCFQGCTSLQNAPTFSSLVLATNLTGMFDACSSLVYVPVYVFAASANLSGCFATCISLEIAPAWDYSAITTGANLFNGCRSLSKGILANAPAVSHSYANCKLSGTALDAVYTALPSAAATITVTGNYGTASDTPSIATGKGWTVTGS